MIRPAANGDVGSYIFNNALKLTGLLMFYLVFSDVMLNWADHSAARSNT